MVGKLNLIEPMPSSPDNATGRVVEQALDDERAHSMADEGGSFPAEVESEPSRGGTPWSVYWNRAPAWAWLAFGTAGMAIGGYALYRFLRDRSEPALQPE